MQGYFSIERVTSLSELQAGSSIHVIGICGVAMAPLALELARRGYLVSGSDKEFFEPMGSVLKRSAIELFQGYKAQNIPAKADLVIIGNAVSRDHPEVEEIERRRLNYSCFPSLLADLILKGRHSIVMAGTHGKSTTTALMAHALQTLGAAPSMFVGAQPHDQASGLVVGSGQYSVVEGDEYDSAFFAKVPKFTFYLPKSVVVTSIEFDHADIYRDLAHVESQFSALIKQLPVDGRAVCCIDCENIRRLMPQWRNSTKAKILTYGRSPDANYRLIGNEPLPGGQKIECAAGGFFLPLTGDHNALNALGIFGLLCELGFHSADAMQSLSNYKGIRRRQELRYHDHATRITVIDDFAHHPTAVRETLKGLRQAYPDARIWAVFEPRSNTSRRKIFQNEYASAFNDADLILLPNIQAKNIDIGHELLSVEELAQTICNAGKNARTIPSASEIVAVLINELKPGDLIVVMSNGGFDGIIEKLLEKLTTYQPDQHRKPL